MDPIMGTIILFAGDFAPLGWALCNGQLLSITQNSALFSILGTTYGGDGVTTFALPDLRGRAPIGEGNGPGLTPRTLGESSGAESVTLIVSQIPAHNHSLDGTKNVASQQDPTNNFLAQSTIYNESGPGNVLNPQSIGLAGGSQPHDNMPPFLAINYIIATQGVYPSRS